MKLVLVSFTLFYSATCVLVLLRGVHVLREALVLCSVRVLFLTSASKKILRIKKGT